MSRENFTELKNRIAYIRNLFHLSKTNFAKRLKISAAYVSNLESGKKTNISKALAELIRREFEFNPDWILSGTGNKFITPNIHGLLPHGLRNIPIMDSIPSDFPANIFKIAERSSQWLGLPSAIVPEVVFGFIVKDESMSPKIKLDDYIIFTAEAFKIGDCVVFISQWGETMIRKYMEKDNEKFLVSENPEYQSFKLSENKVVGKVIKIIRIIDVT